MAKRLGMTRRYTAPFPSSMNTKISASRTQATSNLLKKPGTVSRSSTVPTSNANADITIPPSPFQRVGSHHDDSLASAPMTSGGGSEPNCADVQLHPNAKRDRSRVPDDRPLKVSEPGDGTVDETAATDPSAPSAHDLAIGVESHKRGRLDPNSGLEEKCTGATQKKEMPPITKFESDTISKSRSRSGSSGNKTSSHNKSSMTLTVNSASTTTKRAPADNDDDDFQPFVPSPRQSSASSVGGDGRKSHSMDGNRADSSDKQQKKKRRICSDNDGNSQDARTLPAENEYTDRGRPRRSAVAKAKPLDFGIKDADEDEFD
ncbi:hypothetical protein SeMB42_g07148 [Synchytrium endobioticum]|uniref:Uncharacterized protein n=1 Tax=Synchytrium endobioticum TaxID=286115 RepID=A0A507DGS1_9FUNG|nr:hypothetical protein SeMB42_g07148 [Synchytrium endobioticum]TPX50774.1 hypothetical protein SeLEV6574_g00717 [Synchytrium endobioticum]